MTTGPTHRKATAGTVTGPVSGNGIDAGRRLVNVLIVDEDSDCIDALETLLASMPGVGSIIAATTVAGALDDLTHLADSGASPAAQPPHLVLIDPQTRYGQQVDTVAMLRVVRDRLPDATIVLLNVYPSGMTRSLRRMIDRSIRKDMTYRELANLIDEVARRLHTFPACPAAG